MMEWKFILAYSIFLVAIMLIQSLPDFPPDLKIISPFDFVWFSGGIIGVASACVIASGIPCAGALAIWGITTVWQYVIVSIEWVKLLIFTPLVVTLIFIISRLARGGG
jgi:hypothetical protein